MLGSIQKYRPARRPEPYNSNQRRQLQGMSPSNKQKKRTELKPMTIDITEDSLYKNMPTLKTMLTPQSSITHQFFTSTPGLQVEKAAVYQALDKASVTASGRNSRTLQTSRHFPAGHNRNSNTIQMMDQSRLHSQPYEEIQKSDANVGIGISTDTVMYSIASSNNEKKTPNKRCDKNLFVSSDTWRKVSISESLYSTDKNSQMATLGAQIHSKVREHSKQTRRMNFGSVQRQPGTLNDRAGRRYLPTSIKEAQPLNETQKTSQTSNAKSFRTHKSQLNSTMPQLPAAANEVLQKHYQSKIGNFFSQDQDTTSNIESKRESSLLTDSYLPVLRSFATTQRVNFPSQNQVISKFKKDQAIEEKKKNQPKVNHDNMLMNKTMIESLKERQRNILMRAHMHQPANKQQLQEMNETWHKDWLVRNDEDKKKQEDNLKSKMNGFQSEGDYSSDDYDPLADSDCSSERSANQTKQLAKDKIQNNIQSQMRSKATIQNIQRDFWKELVEVIDPNEPYLDEDGNLITPQKKELTNLQKIKKMVRMKARQKSLPSSEHMLKTLINTAYQQPVFSAEDGENNKFYFDIKNNKEHYALLTNDMTEEQFSIFKQREKERIDQEQYSKIMMNKMIEERLEEYRRARLERESQKRKKVDVDTLGQYRSKKFMHEKMESNFLDDDDLTYLSVLMDTSENKEIVEAIKAHVSKQQNRKVMLCPNRLLRMSDFARDVVDGIIWDEVRERKVHPRVLIKMSQQTEMGIMINREVARKRRIEELKKILRPPVEETNQSAQYVDEEQEKLDMAQQRKQAKNLEPLYKDMLKVSHKKNKFFEAAKQMLNSNFLPDEDIHFKSFQRFYDSCQKSSTLAMPIFSNTKDQILSITGQFISEGMAKAMSEVFARHHLEEKKVTPETNEAEPAADGPNRALKMLDKAAKLIIQNTAAVEHNEDEVQYIIIKEINFDDNGLRDASFANILTSLATQPSLKRISYVNNEIGAMSIAQLSNILKQESTTHLSDLRLTRVRASKHDLNLLLQTLSQCTNKLIRLRLSHLALDEYVLMESLKQMIYSIPHIQELNLSSINIHGRQLSEVMEVISENCQQIQYLNLSYNSLPQQKEWRDNFIQHLVNMITNASKLIDIDLSGMNFQSNVKMIQWPLAKSRTLQAIHLSDNNIPKALEINMLMVFGVKSMDEAGDVTTITAKLNSNQLKRNALTSFQPKTQQSNARDQPGSLKKQTTQYQSPRQDDANSTEEPEMLQSYEDATARIANAIEIRDLKHEKQYIQSCMKGGLGRHFSTVQPLVITRKLGHPELIFNYADGKNTHFTVNSQARWMRSSGNECWICDSWKYTTIFFSRQNWDQHYVEVRDQERINQFEELYDLGQDDLLLVERKDFPLILGSITKNMSISMIDISMFNLFLDERVIKKDLGGHGERAMRTMLTVSQGMKNQFGRRLSGLKQLDWLKRFKESMPFDESEMLIINLPQTELSKKVMQEQTLSFSEQRLRNDESQNDIYVFAGYVEPGKHQIVIKDQKTNRWFSREIVIEARKRDIVECHSVQTKKTQESIKRFQKQSDQTGITKTMVDLDNSVFMNFKRYTKQEVFNCFQADMRRSSLQNIIHNEEDQQICSEVFQENYQAYCQFFHEMAAQFENFPLIDLQDLSKVLYASSMMGESRAEKVGKDVIARYKQIKAANGEPFEGQFLLNRIKFAEVLLIVLAANQKIERSPAKAAQVQRNSSQAVDQQNADMDVIHEEDEAGTCIEDSDPEFEYSPYLRSMFSQFIIPSLENKQLDTMPFSLNAFRDSYCWVEEVNQILELNLEGIMEIFTKFMDETGFAFNAAEKLFKVMGSLISTRVLKILFDLSQMTVIDETTNAAEYEDMELVEFLEFLVRVAFHQYIGDSRSIAEKLSDLLREMLSISNLQFVEPPKQQTLNTQKTSEEDIEVFAKYMQQKTGRD